KSAAGVYRGGVASATGSAGSTSSLAAYIASCNRTSGGEIFPLHAPRRVRPHGGFGEGTWSRRAATFAGNAAYRPASACGFSRRLIEPVGCSHLARIAASALA